jgi:hypothetical protein
MSKDVVYLLHNGRNYLHNGRNYDIHKLKERLVRTNPIGNWFLFVNTERTCLFKCSDTYTDHRDVSCDLCEKDFKCKGTSTWLTTEDVPGAFCIHYCKKINKNNVDAVKSVVAL